MSSALARRVGNLLNARRLTISVCESCTGGMLGAAITAIPGSSEYFLGGIIAYANTVKMKVAGVKPAALRRFGAVSAEVAQAMASVVKKKLRSDIGIGITGIAGPEGGSLDKPVGTVYIAIAINRRVTVQHYLFRGNRDAVRKSACKHALKRLEHILFNV
jgi:PncC family amidohydrolase